MTIRVLPHNSDAAQVVSMDPAHCWDLRRETLDEIAAALRPPEDPPPSNLEVLGTTAPALRSFGNPDDPEWAADLEHVWRSRVAPRVAALHARAKEMRRRMRDVARMETEYSRSDVLLPTMRVQAARAAEWADEHARSLAMTRADVHASCGQRWRGVGCGCGAREMRVGCDQPQLCGTCRRKHSEKWRKRITAGMQRSLAAERKAWHETPAYRRRGMLPGIYLITLTGPHSGDLETDRTAMGKAVRKLFKYADKHRWWETYAMTWEATNGRDGLGHLHCHLAVISSWIPYTGDQVDKLDPDRYRPTSPAQRVPAQRRRDVPVGPLRPAYLRRSRWVRRAPLGLHELWERAMPGAVVVNVQAPRTGADDAGTAGQYLAKYVTKGVDPRDMSGRKAGELLAAFRGKRKVTTSAHFWIAKDPTCECCGDRFRSMGAPLSLQSLMPGAVLRSMAIRYARGRPGWGGGERWRPSRVHKQGAVRFGRSAWR